jgi:hypothetical protein
MIPFDQILPTTAEVLNAHREVLAQLEWVLINRDLNGRVRLILPTSVEADDAQRCQVETLYQALSEQIAAHAFPVSSGILYEPNRDEAIQGATNYPLGGFDNVLVVDRLATEANWAHITPETQGPPRIVFFSIKGGGGPFYCAGRNRVVVGTRGQASTGAGS